MLNQFSRSLRGAAGKGGHVMRKLLALTLSAPLLFAASSAFAADDTSHPGGFAAGVASSLSGTPGLSLRYYVNEKLGLELVASKTSTTPDKAIASDGNVTDGKASGALDFSIAAEYRLASTNAVTFSGYAGFGQTKATVLGEDGNINSKLSIYFDSEPIRVRLRQEQAFDGNIWVWVITVKKN
jgi:outer membrane protein W